jgi:hypothetical protein
MPPARRRAGARTGALSDDVRHALTAEVARLRALPDAQTRVRAVGDFFAAMDDELAAVSAVRLDAVRELRSSGWSYDRLMELSGLSKTRVAQLVRGLRP